MRKDDGGKRPVSRNDFYWSVWHAWILQLCALVGLAAGELDSGSVAPNELRVFGEQKF